MSDILDDLKRTVELLKKAGPAQRPFDSVESCNGVAVFKLRGRVVGWMNWDDFEAACEEL